VFDSTPENVLMHLRNIFASGELEADATTKEFLAVRTEGRRRVRRRLKHYNLDAIISVGYRVNTRRGVRFRQWATRTLHGHLVQGFTLNEHRLAERGLREARETLDLLARTLSSQALVDDTGQAVLDLIAGYADTWRLLLEYDEDRLPAPPGTGSSSGVLDHERAMGAIAEFRRELMAREQASALFGSTRGDALAAILGNIEQTMFGEPLYRSREEQARLRARDAAVDAAHARLPERDRPCGPAEREGPVGGVRDAGSPLTVPDGLAAGRTARGVAVEVTEQVGQFPQAFLILEQLSNDI
ncbi:MAG: virulence RhuM family protein, partial [Boseongicola sp. SB0665_bin_10]|nr:virulence RhuM family protein [Boseongicola sp. SB0665_bin_10]